LAIARIFEQFDLAGDTAEAVWTVALESSRLVKAHAAVLTWLTAAVVSRVMFTQTTFEQIHIFMAYTDNNTIIIIIIERVK